MKAMAVALALALAAAEAPPPSPLPGAGGAPVRESFLAGADGVRLFHRVVGSGQPPIVFVHGGPGTGMREGHDLEDLADAGRAFVMYDQRGSGHSQLVSDPAALAIGKHVADLDAVRRHLGEERLDLVGVSWGAVVVARYAEAHPRRVGRIVFLSPMSPTREHLAQRLAHLAARQGQPAPGDLTALLKSGAARAAAAPDGELAERCRQEWRAFARLYERGGPAHREPRADACDYPAAVLRSRLVVRMAGIESLGPAFDLRPALRRLRATVLVVEGRESEVPLEATREWARAVPDARLLLVPEAGHRNWLDQPDRVKAALSTFFRGGWPEGAGRPD